MTSDSPWDDPDTKRWMEDVRQNMIPMMRDSHVIASIVPTNPEDTDIKFAVELGMAIMMDKPIIAVVRPGTKVPDKLVLIADHILEWDLSDTGGLADRLKQTVNRLKQEMNDE